MLEGRTSVTYRYGLDPASITEVLWRSRTKTGWAIESSTTLRLRRTVLFQRSSTCTRSRRYGIAAATALCIALVSPILAGNKSDSTPTVTTSGLDVKGLARVPGVIFARELKDVPGKNLIVVKLEIPPKSAESPAPGQDIGHTHPGSVYVYVTKGTVRFGIEGQPAQVVHAGESAFESVGDVHTILESASTTKPASAIAVMIMPEGAPILTPVEGHKK
jgi:quercetin dioxygenase-like cupin family protein